jgi:hypothetical protein
MVTNVEGLKTELDRFESIVGIRLPNHPDGKRLAQVLREIYATKSAVRILRLARTFFSPEVLQSDPPEEECQQCPTSLVPSSDVVQRASPILLRAITSNDKSEALEALAEMRVFALSPAIGSSLGRLEFCVGCVNGRARLIPLIELALFATEVADYDRASGYFRQAHCLAPGPPELHDLHTVAGIVAAEAGQVMLANWHLAESIRVCRENDFACLVCGIRNFNVMLAEKLLELGERDSVVEYLSDCQIVWSHQTQLIADWIQAVRTGRRPNFLASTFWRVMVNPQMKIRELVVRASFLGSGGADMEAAATLSKEEMLAEYKREMSAAIRGKLEVGDN